MSDRAEGAEQAPHGTPAVIVVLIGICVVIEAILTLADWGLVGTPWLRKTVYEYGAFWPGLLHNWRPNYPGQAAAMFLTHAFLHGGLTHLAMNMITLWSLGRAVAERAGSLRFNLIYFGSAIAGAGFFAAITTSLVPMVGASGALFGLAGALVGWNWDDRRRQGLDLWPAVQAVLFLAGINLILWWAMAGQLAWEAHLGGFIAGWVLGRLLDPPGVEEV